MLLQTDRTKALIKTAALRALLKKGVETERELYFLVTEGLGVRIPFDTCCEDHVSAWEVLRDDFFHRTRKQAFRHSRGGGKTKTVATGKAAKLIAMPGMRIANFAASENQGQALYTYVQQMLGPTADVAIQEVLDQLYGSTASTISRPVPDVDITGAVIRGEDGMPKSSHSEPGIMRVLVGTLRGVNSAHVDDLVVDERAQMEDAIFKEAMGMMTAHEPYPGILTVISTVKAKGDAMDVLMDEAEDRGYKPYTSCLLDVITCRERNCDGCKATIAVSDDKQRALSFYDFCQGRLLGRSLGHYSVASARDKFVEMGLDSAEAQLFCLKPEGSERAFPQWSHINQKDLDEKVRLQGLGFYVFGDFGKADLNVFQKAYWIAREKTIYVSDELTGTGQTIQEWIPQLEEKGWGEAMAFLVDVAGRQTTITSKVSAIEHLENQGWQVIAERMEELPTTERLRDVIKAGQLVVHPRCKKTIEAFNRATNQSIGHGDNKVFMRIIKHNKFSHPCDAARYGVNLLSPDDEQAVTELKRRGGR